MFKKTIVTLLVLASIIGFSNQAFATTTPGWEGLNREDKELNRMDTTRYWKIITVQGTETEGDCASNAMTPEGEWMYRFKSSYSSSYQPTMLTGSGGYFQPDLSKWPEKMISADMMNYLRGNVPDKFYGIKIRNGDRAYEYAKKYYEKIAPGLREEMTIIKKKVATPQQCSRRNDLFSVVLMGKSWNYRNYTKAALVDWTKNPWNRWDKNGNNRKVRAYVTLLTLFEATQNADNEFYDIFDHYGYRWPLEPSKNDKNRDQFPELKNLRKQGE